MDVHQNNAIFLLSQMSVFETYLFIVDPFGGCDGHLNYRQAISVKKNSHFIHFSPKYRCSMNKIYISE